MAVTTIVRRLGPALYGVDGLAEDEIRGLPVNTDLKVTITKARSLKHLRLYWAMIKKVIENLETPVTKEALSDWVKIRCGIVDLVPLKSGATFEAPGSIAFENMDQLEFNAFFERAAELLVEHVIPGLSKPALIREARLMLKWPVEDAA